MISYRATRIGIHAHQFIQDSGNAGAQATVVTTFRHGFNMLCLKAGNPCILSVQTDAVPLHPWAIEIAEASLESSLGVACRISLGEVRIGTQLLIDCSHADIASLRIAPWNQEQAAQALQHASLLRSSLEDQEHAPNLPHVDPNIYRILAKWRLKSDSRVLTRLVGLGFGSTPSGDDVLVGILAALTAQAGSSPWAKIELDTLGGELRSTSNTARTTLPSAQMLESATIGSFSEPLCRLADDLKQELTASTRLKQSIALVLRLGSTSGYAFLLGIWSACRPPGFQAEDWIRYSGDH